MPITPDYFTKRRAPAEAALTTSQAQTQAPAQAPAQDDLIQTPVSEQQASLQRRPPGGPVSGALEGVRERNIDAINASPVFLQPLMAVGEAAARKLDAAARLGLEVGRALAFQPPKSGTIQGLSDIGEVVTGFVAPAAVATGLATEALSRSLGADEDTGRWLAQGAEMLMPVGQGVAAGRRTFERGRELLTSEGRRLLTRPGQASAATRIGTSARFPGRNPAAVVGGQIKALIPNQLRRRGAQLGPEIGKLERQFADTGWSLDPTDPAYARLEKQFRAAEGISQIGGPAGKQFSSVLESFANNQPITGHQLADLTHSLVEPARAVIGVAEPRLAAVAAAKVRSEITRTFKEAMPRDMALRYQGARLRYGREVGRPRSILAKAYSDSVSPTQLFNEVFSGNDPYTLETIVEVARHRPALRTKLGLGYLENLARGANNWQDARAALAALRNTRGIIEPAGIIKTQDLDNLEYFLQRRALPQLVESFQALVGTTSGAVRGSAATAGAYVASGKPSTMLAALIMSGSLAPMRRLMMLPKGSPAGKRAATVVMSNIAKLMREAQESSQQPVEGEEELRELMSPKYR